MNFEEYLDDTSLQAWEDIQDCIGFQERQILEAIVMKNGLTCDEVEVETGLSHQTASARITTMHKKKGLLYDCGERRETRSKRMAKVWKCIVEKKSQDEHFIVSDLGFGVIE